MSSGFKSLIALETSASAIDELGLRWEYLWFGPREALEPGSEKTLLNDCNVD